MSTESRPDLRLLGSAALLAVYALPLFVPPAAQPVSTPASDTWLLERVFPDVPAWWVAIRLMALTVGAVLAAGSITRPPTAALHPARRSVGAAAAELPRSTLLAALAVAGLHAATALAAAHLGRALQSIYVVLLIVPALVIWRSERFVRVRARAGWLRGYAALPVIGVLALWVVTRLFAALHSPRAADPVDVWHNFAWFARAVADDRNLLTQSSELGVSDAYMLLLGPSALRAVGMSASFAWVQVVQVLWLAVTGWLIAQLAAALSGRASAPLAVAAALFSPFVLWLPYSGAPFGIQTCLAAAVLWFSFLVYTRASIAALAALGGIAGFAATIPQLMPLVLVAGLVAVPELWRRPRPPAVAWASPLLSFLAAVVPALPDLETLRMIAGRYAGLHAHWAQLEALLLGQRAIGDAMSVWEVWQSGRPGALDIPVGGMLLPFAVARTPLRLWGDTLFDPVGSALAACGLAICARFARRDRGARILLGLLFLAVLPAAMASAYDRVSATRAILLAVVIPLFAAVGFSGFRHGLAPHVRSGVVAVVSTVFIAVGGTILFDLVTPRIVATSWLHVALQALRDSPPPGGAVLLQHGGLKVDWQDPRVGEAARVFRRFQPAVEAAREDPDAAAGKRTRFEWLHVERIATQLPAAPVPVRSYDGPASLVRSDAEGEPLAELYLWSPGLEADYDVLRSICERWPAAEIYTLYDRAGLSRALAARVGGPGWTPGLPASQWREANCQLASPE